MKLIFKQSGTLVKGNIAIHNNYKLITRNVMMAGMKIFKRFEWKYYYAQLLGRGKRKIPGQGCEKYFDKNRPTDYQDNIDMDHTISAGEVIKRS